MYWKNNVVSFDCFSYLDRSKWFGELPWEESLRDEHEFGKLVLFQNLDPAYSSAEVEDIVWNAFNETCRAKMVQQTALYFLLPCNVYSHRQIIGSSISLKARRGSLTLSIDYIGRF
ncbi:protein ANTI-SILENCING 1 isoform X3 [Gossypium hirsutum]|uniref:Protein ANTI-SILENCING 1 isoform X3 n=1 Tax=Gossypium hirsutum TaxID=3635 RepID=A0ABM2ZRI5_GOSHI|nr:protein ANTI-SILENCING 1-like isoform X3 [Gossypium hirsutum]